MKEKKLLEAATLWKEAAASEHQESYQTLEKTPNYRIGVGARLTHPNLPSFFVEVLIYLCPNHSNAYLTTLENSLTCLKELKAGKYALTCQDNCVSCETTLPAHKLSEEYGKVEAIMKASFG